MASKNVVRQDIVQISYDIDDSGLTSISREINEMKSDIVKGVNTSETALNDLQKETNQTGNKFREAEKDANKFNEELKDTQDEAKGASGILDKLKDTLGGLSFGGIGAAVAGIGAAFGFANNGVKAMNQLQAQTGATKAEMQELGGIAKEVYANNMGESLDDVVKSMATVKNTTNTSGKELQGLTHNALLLRDTFDFDVNESVRSADMLMRQFGVTGDEAYNLIAQGAQLGLDKNGNLLDSFNEYSVHFKQLGLSATDMMSIFANSAEQGVFDIDKIGDAVKEFGIRAIDGSKTTSEGFATIGLNADTMAAKFAAGGDSAKNAFQETVNALAGMKDPVAQNAAGVALFGTMWEDLGSKAVLAMSTTNSRVNESKNALEEINQVKYQDATSALSALGRTINVELGDAMSASVGVVVEAINKLKSGVQAVASFTKEHWSTIKPIIMGVAIVLGTYLAILSAYTIGTKLAAAAEYIKSGALLASAKAMWANNTAMLASPMTWIVLGIMALIAAIVLLVKNWDTVKAAVLSFTSTAMGYLSTFWNWLKGIFSAIGSFIVSIFTGIASFLSGIWQSIWSVIGGAVMAIWGVISTAFSYARQIVFAIMQGIWSKITAVWSSIVSVVGGFVQSLWSKVQSAFQRVASTVSSVMSKIMSVIRSIWSNIVSVVGNFVGKIWSKVTSKFNQLVSWLSNLKSKFLSVGKNLIKGLLDGITNKMGDLKKKVKEIGDNVLGGVKDFFGIKSPSKEFAIVGRYNIEGLEKGMESSLPSLKRTVDTVGNSTLKQSVSSVAEPNGAIASGYAYTPENSSIVNHTSRNETNTYSPQFNLTINGADDTRDIEHKVKQWVKEAMQETFRGYGRRNPRLQEV